MVPVTVHDDRSSYCQAKICIQCLLKNLASSIGDDSMLSSFVTLDVDTSASMLTSSNGVKRKMDDGVSDLATHWEHELCWEDFKQDAKRHCKTSNQLKLDSSYTKFCSMELESKNMEPMMQQESSGRMSSLQQLQCDVKSVTEELASAAADMEVEFINECNTVMEPNSVEREDKQQQQAQALNYTATRSSWSSVGPRCYCRRSWDPSSDLVPYVSDIY